MPRATAAAAAETAASILDVAERLFVERGFSESSVDDIARAASVTRGAVYHHYGSKEGVFRAVVARLQDRVAAAVVRAADEEAGARERLTTGCHAFLDAITSGAAARILLVQAPAVLGWTAWRAGDAATSGAHLRDALVEAGVADPLVDALAAQLSGAMNEAALWVSESRDPDARSRAHDTLDLLLAVVP
jgi:AcrR family transcriptional regulator